MATDAANASMRARSVGDVLRFHNRVTRFAAERHGFGVFISLVTAKRTGGNKHKRNHQKHEKRPARSRIIKIELWVGSDFRRRHFMPAPAFHHPAHYHDDQSEDQD